MTDLLILDLDGTLIDSTYHHALAWHRAFATEDIEVPLWRVHRAVGLGGDRLISHVAGDEVGSLAGAALRHEWAVRYRELVGEVTQLPGAVALVEDARRRDIAVVLASSGEHEFVDQALDLLDIRGALTAVVSSADVEDAKPDPDILALACEKVDADRALMVGDTTWDAQAAARLGIPCVGVQSGGFGAAELRDAGASVVWDGPDGFAGCDWTRLLTPCHV
ncbi:MAG: HAD family hydrolase [Micrococcales bacterium]|nr:HAD family hydrolase [Micrococcales bacterium]